MQVAAINDFSRISAGQLKTLALDQGFDLCGIVSLRPDPDFRYFERWLEKGFHAEMSYLERNTRFRENPRLLLPEARTALVVGLSYFWPTPLERHPAISRYARGLDYHLVIREKLRRLVDRLEAILDGKALHRICVDTAPIMERSLAQQAGLGWIGKNHCLINDRYGSFVALGELLLPFDLPEDRVAGNRCGECRLCIDRCPTGALANDGLFDARKCLSYLTIEYRGELEPSFHPYLAEMFFGCDRCQECCPWNRNPLPSACDQFRPREWSDFEFLKSISPKEQKRKLRESALQRLPWPNLMHNMRIAENEGKRLRTLR